MFYINAQKSNIRHSLARDIRDAQILYRFGGTQNPPGFISMAAPYYPPTISPSEDDGRLFFQRTHRSALFPPSESFLARLGPSWADMIRGREECAYAWPADIVTNQSATARLHNLHSTLSYPFIPISIFRSTNMEYQYSDVLDPSSYETHGLDLGIPLRVHNDTDASEIRGAQRVQNDWTKLVKPVQGYKGGIGERFSFIGACVPECLPERIEIISYSNEFAFLYDGEVLSIRYIIR